MRNINRTFLGATVSLALLLPGSASAVVPESFWTMVEQLSIATKQGKAALASRWPNQSPTLLIEETGPMQTINKGPFSIERNWIRSTQSEIRIFKGKLDLVIVSLDGVCVTPFEIDEKYPGNKKFFFPQPGRADPVSYRRINLSGVRISFGFQEKPPGCLIDVIFNPNR